MEAIEKHFPMVLFVMLYEGVPNFDSVDEIRVYRLTIEIPKLTINSYEKNIQQYFPVVLFVINCDVCFLA